LALTDFNVGIDCQLVLISNGIGQVDPQHVTEFQAEQLRHEVIVHRLNAFPLGRYVPGGWRGRFQMERGTSAIEDAIAAAEAGFWNGQRLMTGLIYQYINEIDGSTSTWQFNAATICLPESGQWRQQNSTRQTLEFFAGLRVRM
jgi:hypothetical protein